MAALRQLFQQASSPWLQAGVSLIYTTTDIVVQMYTQTWKKQAEPSHQKTNPAESLEGFLSLKWKGTETSLSCLVKLSRQTNTSPDVILPSCYEALWFVCIGIPNTQPDWAQRVQTQRNHCSAWSPVQIWICVGTVCCHKHTQPLYRYKHTHTCATPCGSHTGTLNGPYSDLPACLAASAVAESS